MSLFSVILVLFLIMDPLGNLSSFLSLTKGLEPKKQKQIVIREMLIALAAMLIFNFLGDSIAEIFHLSGTTVMITSGLILFLIAIKILFTSPDSLRANLPQGEPFIFPLAIPLIAGPGLLATIMLYAIIEPSLSVMLAAILITWAISALIFYFAEPIKRVLGHNGLTACERLIGMVLVLIAVQRFLEGILLFWSTQPHPV